MTAAAAVCLAAPATADTGAAAFAVMNAITAASTRCAAAAANRATEIEAGRRGQPAMRPLLRTGRRPADESEYVNQ